MVLFSYSILYFIIEDTQSNHGVMSAALPMPAQVPSVVLSLDHHPIAIVPAARKRRRDFDEEGSDDATMEDEERTMVLQQHAGQPPSEDILLPAPLVAAPPIVTVLPSRGGPSSSKRPQLKYDPSVPMTREQTSAWRREQRRKRNRESAAACRRRQRELVSVLEVEVASWRHKFEHALAMVRARDGEGAAAGLEAELERMFVLQPRKITEEEDWGRDTPPPPVPEKTLSSSSASVAVQIIVSPTYNRSIDAYLDTSSGEEEDLHFPILEDLTKAKNGSNFMPGAIQADRHSNVAKSRVESRRHLNELITTSAEVRRLLRGALGGWTVDFTSCGYGTLTQ